jgi:hypothetical protein
MDGAATLTIVESRIFMIIAARTTAKPVHLRWAAPGSIVGRGTAGASVSFTVAVTAAPSVFPDEGFGSSTPQR